MRITTKLVIDMNSGAVLEHEHYGYDGPLALAGGGPSQSQKNAAAAEANLANQQAGISAGKDAREAKEFAIAQPYIQQRLDHGLPFFNALTDAQGGVNARAFAPAYARLNRQFSDQPDGPSGSKDAAFRALDASKAQAFDGGLTQNLFLNDQAKQDALNALTGQQSLAQAGALGAAGAANSANNNILSSTSLATPGLGGIIGSIAGAGLGGFLSNPNVGKQGGIPF